MVVFGAFVIGTGGLGAVVGGAGAATAGAAGATAAATAATAGAGATAAATVGATVGAAAGAAAGGTAAAATGATAGAAITAAAAGAGAGAGVGVAAGTAAGGAAAAGGTAAGAAAAAAMGPIGWVALGATTTTNTSENVQEYSWDCWKPLLHNKSQEKSKGRLLKDVLCDKRILSVVSYGLSSGDASKCSFIVKNIWNETFDIKPVILHNGNIAFHATKQLI